MTVKVAQSLDGKIALREGMRTYLTDGLANADVDQVRAGQQAILVGSETALADDPQLLVKQAVMYPPIRIVLDRRGRLQTSSRLHEQHGAPLWIFTENAQLKTRFTAANERIFVGKWTIQTVIEVLAKAGVQSLLVEGGSTIQAAFLQAGLVDQLIIYQVAELFGGNSLPAFAQMQSGERYAFHELSTEIIGNARKSVFERVVN
ncbi:RibD family protein [Furfurilactobacillus siliginis]|uniref:RibD family protein n=1 Tax=Furfurilactobacillus siliginis TaxID=348151 RepID=UPI000B33BE34|nr:RibD family protein [Furfurilactobacillus siliginis]